MKFLNNINLQNKKRFFIYIFISIIISLFIGKISESKDIWFNFWHYFNIPAMWPAFADIDFIHRSLICKLKGIDPTIYNPCGINETRYQYPLIWLTIFENLNLNVFKNFKNFLYITLSLLFFCYFLLLEKSKKKFNKTILIFLFFSTSSSLLIERGNIDHIIFIIAVFIIFYSNYYYELFIIFLNSLLKVYPVFAFFYLTKYKKKIFFTLFSMILCFYLIYEISIAKYLDANHSFMAISQAYGVQSITEGIFKTLEKKYSYFIDANTKNFIRLFSSLIFLFVCSLIFLIGSRRNSRIFSNINDQEKLFLIGSTIYIGSYIFYSNIDYRLVFLYLTIPYIENFKNKINFTYCFSVLIISNSFIFSFAPLTINHIIYTSFLYFIKLMILFFLCFNIGKISKNLLFNIKEKFMFLK